MIKFYEYFILLILVSKSVGLDEEEMAQSLHRRTNFRKRLQSLDSEADLLTSLLSESKRHSLRANTGTDDSSSEDIEDPVRIAIFNAGDYDVHIKLNYVLNGVQTEDEILTDIKSGRHRSLFIPAGATFIRIRVNQTGIIHDKLVIDEYVADLNDSTGYCYLLAHSSSHPVYGRCPSTYRDMLEAWGVS